MAIRDRAPVAVAVPQAYLHAGAEAAVGALIAHTGRERDGLGQHIDVSVQTATMMATQGTVLAGAWGASDTVRLAGGVNFGGIPLRFIYPASDGFVSVTFLFGTAIGPFTRRLMEAIHDEGIIDEATRDKDWLNYTTLLVTGQEPPEELMRCIAALETFTKGHTRAELFDMALTKSLLIVPVQTAPPTWLVRSSSLPETSGSASSIQKLPRRSHIPVHIRWPDRHAHQVSKKASAARRAQRRVTPSPARPGATAARSSKRDLPLAGIKVADFMWVLAGPWGTRYLADYGATVVHVESATRVDTARTHWAVQGQHARPRSLRQSTLRPTPASSDSNSTSQRRRGVRSRSGSRIGLTWSPRALRPAPRRGWGSVTTNFPRRTPASS